MLNTTYIKYKTREGICNKNILHYYKALQVIMICHHFYIIAINDKEKIYIKPISFGDKKWDIILWKVCRKRYMFGVNKFEKRCKNYTSICLFLYIKSVSCSTVFFLLKSLLH